MSGESGEFWCHKAPPAEGRQGGKERGVRQRCRETILPIVPRCTKKGTRWRDRQLTGYLHPDKNSDSPLVNNGGYCITDGIHQAKTCEILWLSYTTVVLEEFVMVMGKMSDILSAPSTQNMPNVVRDEILDANLVA